MITRVIKNLYYPNSIFTLIIQKEHFKIGREIIYKLEKDYNLNYILIDSITEGTACTALLAKNLIDNNENLLIANCDQLIDYKIAEFINDAISRKLDGSILTFRDFKRDPKWSFVKLNKYGLVEEVQEKKPISDIATVGIYYFDKGSYFVEAASKIIKKKQKVNNEYYTCPVYNILIDKKRKIGTFDIERKNMHGLGTPEDLLNYLESYR